MKKMNNNITWFPDSLLAWEYFNEAFLSGEGGLPFVFHTTTATYVYDLVFGIVDPRLPNNIDFGKLFNYSSAKWTLLVSNYLDRYVMDNTKREVTSLHKKGLVYNYSMPFTNNHSHGKKCLLSVVFSKRCNETNPTISVYLRASEVTKRLIFDFLLIQRIGEYVYGNNNFKMVFHVNQMFNDNTVLLMYHAYKDIKGILKNKKDKRSIKLLENLNIFLEKPIDSIKYKIHKRVAKVLQKGIKKPKTLVKDCKLPF